MKTFILAIILATTAIAAAAQGYPGPQGGFYVYGPDHEYHLASRNHPVMGSFAAVRHGNSSVCWPT